MFLRLLLGCALAGGVWTLAGCSAPEPAVDTGPPAANSGMGIKSKTTAEEAVNNNPNVSPEAKRRFNEETQKARSEGLTGR